MIPPGAFPRLTADNHRVTNPSSREYNCIAWAAGVTDVWWWPDPQEVGFWPPGIVRSETIPGFIEAFRTLGYQPCADAEFEEGFEKIAVYALEGHPTHAARQLSSRFWTSKLGIQEDIAHGLEGLNGPAYGEVAIILKRPRVTSD